MKILFISLWFPFPQDNGSRIRVYHLLQALTKKNQVHLVSFLYPESKATINDIQELRLEKVEIIRRDPFYREPRYKYVGHLSIYPRDVILTHSHEMEQLVYRMCKVQKYDVIIASNLFSIPYIESIRNVPLLLEEHNFLTGWMEERYQNSPKNIKRIPRWVTWQKSKQYEKRMYPRFKIVTMVSDRDKDSVLRSIPNYHGSVEVIPNGVDLKTRIFSSGTPKEGTLIFNGSMTYSANADAMRYFILDIWPLIKKQLPDSQLIITGGLEGVDLSWMPNDSNITLTGYLINVIPIIASSWGCIVPLRDGSGTRLKILEAMAIGTPVISTSKGFEGIEAENGIHILIADGPEDFSRECIRLLTDTNLRKHLSIQARNLVERKYSWDRIGEKFSDLVDGLAMKNQT